ncbi:type II secretion system F family protein [Salinactinospora qingdaonensis]|uniref:Type II secretion system protein GspF domain-containing protein n=1 Tax=Salinactinospora qingdaonensis TaxID=702744 RepID=A0ABP7F3R0_9ACTN
MILAFPPAGRSAFAHLPWLFWPPPEVWLWLFAVAAASFVAVHALPSPPRVRLTALTRASRAGRARRAVHAGHLVWRALRRRADHSLGRGSAQWQRATVDLCRGMATELRGGRPPPTALAAAVAELPPEVASRLAPVVAAANTGHDPTTALRSAARRPGAAGLSYLAACWQVAAGTGGGLAPVVEHLADGLAEAAARRAELNAQLAGPRTTALLLAGLPLVGLAMAAAMGASPVVFLLTTPVGLGCLTAGIVLELLGFWWVQRLVRRTLATLDP